MSTIWSTFANLAYFLLELSTNSLLALSRFYALFSLYNSKMGAMLCPLDSGPVLDLRTHEQRPIQAQTICFVRFKNSRQLFIHFIALLSLLIYVLFFLKKLITVLLIAIETIYLILAFKQSKNIVFYMTPLIFIATYVIII